MKRIIAFILTLAITIGMVACLEGCNGNIKSDNDIYFSKGQFFSYFVYEKNMTSQVYTAEEITKCMDGSVEAEIISEWGYLSHDYAISNLSKPVDRETVVTLCANSTFDLIEGNIKDIKDADLLHDPQTIANAYASGLIELNNGYFEGARKMSFADCDDIMRKTEVYSANIHYDNHTRNPKMADDVIVDDGSDYNEGDVVIQFFFFFNQSNLIGLSQQYDSNLLNENLTKLPYNDNRNDSTMQLSTCSYNSQKLTAMSNSSNSVRNMDNRFGNIGLPGLGFFAVINKERFENNFTCPDIGSTMTLSKYDVIGGSNFVLGNSGQDVIIGVLRSCEFKNGKYYCVFDYPDFEQAASRVEEKKLNAKKISGGEQLESNIKGWKLDFNWSGDSLSIEAKKDYVEKETGRKQDWQNAVNTIHGTIKYTLSDFNIDVNNISSFATKSGEGFIKITADSELKINLEGHAKFAPDSNRNGKFFSNFSNSRLTDVDSPGADKIKVASFTPSLYGIIGAKIEVYVLIGVDGMITFTSSVDDGGIMIKTNNGNVSREKVYNSAKKELQIEINLRAKFCVDVKVQLFGFINVIDYDFGLADAEAKFMANLYYENKLTNKNVFNTPRSDLDTFQSTNETFNYCIGFSLEVCFTGELKDSAAKIIVDKISSGALNFKSNPYLSVSFHVEDGQVVDACTRGDDPSEDLKASDDDSIKLDTYKVTMPIFSCRTVQLKEIPTETVNLYNSRNSIEVRSEDESIVKAFYNKGSTYISLEAMVRIQN